MGKSRDEIKKAFDSANTKYKQHSKDEDKSKVVELGSALLNADVGYAEDTIVQDFNEMQGYRANVLIN